MTISDDLKAELDAALATVKRVAELIESIGQEATDDDHE